MADPILRRRIVLALALAAAGLLVAQEPEPPGEPAPAAPAAPTPAATVPRSDIQGSAYVGRNRWVAGATLLAISETDPGVIYLTATDAKGIFKLQGVPDGSYHAELSREGLVTVAKSGVQVRAPFRAMVEVPMQAAGASAPAPPPGGSSAPAEPPADPDRRPSVALPVPTLNLSGIVVDRARKPVPDITVRLRREGGQQDPRLLLTGTDGNFATEGLVAGNYGIEVSGVGYLTLRARTTLTSEARLRVIAVEQPPDYAPTPLDLLPPELPIPPPGLEEPAPVPAAAPAPASPTVPAVLPTLDPATVAEPAR